MVAQGGWPNLENLMKPLSLAITTLPTIFLVFSLSACTGSDDECEYGLGAPQEELLEKRNPISGQCEFTGFGGGGGGGECCGTAGCNDLAEPVPANEDWADCYVQCEGLDESACLGAGRCRGAYIGEEFAECWGTAPSGPLTLGDCSSFDAQTCSQYEDCIAIHSTGVPIGEFLSCEPESSDPDPEVGSCIGEVACDGPAPECPDGTIAGRVVGGCWTGFCIPLEQCDEIPSCESQTEPQCTGRPDCSTTYVGDNCTCNGDACTCVDWIFDECEGAA